MAVRFLTLIAGGLLIALAVAVSLISESPSITVWIPAFLGIPLVVCGLIALKPEARAAAVHVALLLGLLGGVASLVKLVQSMTDPEASGLAAMSQLAMFVICAAYVILGVRSFLRRGEPASWPRRE